MKAYCTIAFIIIFLNTYAQNKPDTVLYRVETTDGNEYIGYRVRQDDTILVLKTDKLGEVTLRKTDIKNIREITAKQFKNGEYWFENPQSTRYFWQPNAYGLKKGEGYYQNVWIFFHQASIGVTDNFSIGAGIIPLFLFAGAPSPVWLTPKVSIPIKRDKVNLSAGALLGTIFGETGTNFGIAYGTTTIGSRDRNFSIGLGYGYAGSGWADAPTVSFSAMIRTGKRGYLITENYYIGVADDDVMLFFLGGRRMIRNSGIDFGVLIPTKTGGQLYAIPWLGLTFPIGKALKSKDN